MRGCGLETAPDFLWKLAMKSNMHHIFTKSCYRQTYQNYEQLPQRSKFWSFWSFFSVENKLVESFHFFFLLCILSMRPILVISTECIYSFMASLHKKSWTYSSFGHLYMSLLELLRKYKHVPKTVVRFVKYFSNDFQTFSYKE